ncbi:MAG: hypothetical protein ACI4P6_06325 [Candidatus Spyradosoma sp.]
MRQETTQGAMMNETISERGISAAEWERIIYELWDECDFEKLYVAAMLCAKECRYRAEDFGGEEWRYWTRADLEVKF